MPTDVREHIAAEVRAELARQGKTQRDIAAVLDLPQPSVQLRLAGKRSFRAEELALLAESLGVPVSQFMPNEVDAA
jgi:transcriptional regulator with XRE-family HTH domain